MAKIFFAMLFSFLSSGRQISNTVPVVKPDGSFSGYRFTKIEPDSVWERLELKTGDVVTEIDGSVVDSPTKAVVLSNKLKEKGSHQVMIERSGKKIVKTLNVPN